MAEIKYESKIGQIAANDVAVFRVLSNLENMPRLAMKSTLIGMPMQM